MPHRSISVPGWPRGKGYTDGILVEAGKRLLFVSGQIGWDESRVLVSTDLTQQFRRSLENVLAVVREAGGGPETIVRLTIYVKGKRAYLASQREVGEAYRAVLGRHFPAMSLVEVQDLLEPGALVEIEATAAL